MPADRIDAVEVGGTESEQEVAWRRLFLRRLARRAGIPEGQKGKFVVDVDDDGFRVDGRLELDVDCGFRGRCGRYRIVPPAPEQEGDTTWAKCAVCGGNVFRHYNWSHEGGTPPQDHDATPDEEGE